MNNVSLTEEHSSRESLPLHHSCFFTYSVMTVGNSVFLLLLIKPINCI